MARSRWISCVTKGLSGTILVAMLGVITWPSAVLAHGPSDITLRNGWAVQSSAKVSGDGAAISHVGFATNDWYKTTAPNTVFAVLVENGIYKDPYFGMNLRSVPGVKYAIGSEFANQEMPPDSPYAVPWWYRDEFEVPANFSGKTVWLAFRGINYRANLWVNGQKVAGSDEIVGAFRRYEFDVTRFVKAGQKNAVALEISAPKADELGITFVDWNPTPPDKDMGLWQEVVLSASGPVAVRHAFVESRLNSPSNDEGQLFVRTELRNTSQQPVKGTLRGKITGGGAPIEFSLPVEIAAGENKTVTISPDSVAALSVSHPRLWWPYQMGQPYLHQLTLEFVGEGGRVSDTQTIAFGINQIASEFTPEGGRLFRVNGKPVLIRGGGWTPDMMLRVDEQRREAEFRYVKEMGLNTIRLEGKLENEAFMERADREGILVMAGWCCCDAWEKWGKWNEEAKRVSVSSLRDQLLRLRAHPSVVMWLNGSDNPPPADREQAYLDVEKELNWPKPVVSSASAKKAELSGDSGVKMSGPYEYVSPNYWLLGTKFGGALGFNTETSPGPAVPPLEELKAMFPPDKLWPINEYWDYHAGGGEFKNIYVFAKALESRYGKAKDVADFAWKSQLMTYEGERAMFEAYGRNKYKSTGIIQWMLNNAWPGLIWHLYDYHLRPAGGYFGSKEALKLLHVQYSYDDRTVAVVNGKQEPASGLKIAAKLYDLNLQEKFSREEKVDVGADAVTTGFAVPEPADVSTAYFLKLQLLSPSGEVLDRNFYWLSRKADELDFAKSEWYYTPLSAYGDFTALQEVPNATVRAAASWGEEGNDRLARVKVENTGKTLALMTRLRILRGKGGPEVLPVFWEDNYFALLPGETRNVTVKIRKSDGNNEPLALAVDGYNVTPYEQ
jgi:exo-1,4-beta-D-glucosaminidase